MMPRLSPRQLTILGLLADGMTSQQVAEALFMHRVTVERHITEARFKLDARNRTQAVAKAIRNGLI
jgi:DNA-binding CsgD family transcriptional regulator